LSQSTRKSTSLDLAVIWNYATGWTTAQNYVAAALTNHLETEAL
jgi:hypothetical protein